MISVIIPVYNVEDYLHVCINSVLKQSYQDFEIICIDDASTDSSLEILEYFAKKDSRIIVLRNDSNKGPGYTRNRGLGIAQGKYILFLDADDWLSSNAFEKLVDCAEKDNLDLLLFKNIFYYEDSKEFGIEDCYDMDLMNNFKEKIFNHFDLDKTKLFNISKSSVNKFYLKSLLDKNNIRFPNENLINEDNPFFYNVITHARRVSFINENLYNMRERSDSLIKKDNERLFDNIDISYLILQVFLDDFQLYQFYKKELLSYIFVEFLDKTYNNIEKTFKENFFRCCQNVYRDFIKTYDLYDAILESVDKKILNKFKFKKLLENLPKFSIIVPIYNTEDDLSGVLDSIVNQTIGLENFEVILVDDCSTDKSPYIIDEYSKKYENFIPIHLKENSASPSKPRNIGIRNASSDYIIFQDSDDGFTKDACKLLYETIIEEDVDIVTGMICQNNEGEYKIAIYPWLNVLNKYEKFREKGSENILKSKDFFKLKLDSIDENKFILSDYALNSKIFRKSLFLRNNIKFPEDLNGGEDAVVLFNTYIKAEGIVFINKVIYQYNMLRSDSLTHDYSLKTVQNRPKAYKLMYDLSIKNNKKEIFIENILGAKLNYWINNHLTVSPNVTYQDILKIFKAHQILFSECLIYNLNLSDFLKSICEDIKNNKFDDAVGKIMEKRKENNI